MEMQIVYPRTVTFLFALSFKGLILSTLQHITRIQKRFINWMRGYFFRTFKSLTVDRDWRCPKEILTEIDTCSKRDTEVAT